MIIDLSSNNCDIETLLSQFKSITSNSKQIDQDCLFCALDNLKHSGDYFILNAIENRAKGVLLSEGSEFDFKQISKLRSDIIWIRSKNVVEDYINIFKHFYKKLPKNILAVTGTDGKSSIVEYFKQVINGYSMSAASIGTLGVYVDNKLVEKTESTTLSLDQTMKHLNNFTKKEIEYVGLEASSHGLDQKRLDAVPVRFAIFTNIHHDHLDYHKTFDNYLSAKLRLFENLLVEGGFAIISNDFIKLDYLTKIAKKKNFKIITYNDKDVLTGVLKSPNGDVDLRMSDVRLLDYKLGVGGISAKISCLGNEISFEAPVFGFFQISNLMLVLAVVRLLNFDMSLVPKILSSIKSPKGRLEMVAKSNMGGAIFVDYSHTPNALKLALTTLREHFSKNNGKIKIWLIFGCGGQRDTAKREMMAKIARKLADEVIITDDNPRFENASEIRMNIQKYHKTAKNISPRHKAITDCLNQANENDIILIAGKGHEEYQIIDDQYYYYSDHQVVENYIKFSSLNKWS